MVNSHLIHIYNTRQQKKSVNEEEAIQRLADLAMEFHCLSIKSNSDNGEKMKEDMMLKGIIYDEDQTVEETVTFDLKIFYEFIRFDMNNENVGNMLQLMYDSMGSNFEKKKNQG